MFRESDVLSASVGAFVPGDRKALRTKAVQSETGSSTGTDGLDALLIGTSPAMCTLRALIRRIAASDAPVLVTGPSGAGKELVARALHQTSRRRGGPLVPVNCGAIPGELIEAELFGHEKGSFTGAVAQRAGRFERADGGTLFLDELGDMPLAMQVRLLRVLEDRLVERVGGTRPMSVDVRVVGATHCDVAAAVRAGAFREDLFYRLAVITLTVPSLAERLGDIPALIDHFLTGYAVEDHPALTPAAMAVLMTHDWPGNVRELRNVVARAVALYGSETIDAADAAALIGTGFRRAESAAPHHEAMATVGAATEGLTANPLDLKALVTDIERRHLIAALDAAQGVVADAARLVSLNRTTFLEKMRRHGVTRAAA